MPDVDAGARIAHAAAGHAQDRVVPAGQIAGAIATFDGNFAEVRL